MRLETPAPEAVLDAIRAPIAEAGGVPVTTPVAEPLSLYLDIAGESLRERLFVVQGPAREEYCLRPDFTLGVARAHITGGAAQGRYLYEGPAFRVAPPGSGRAEQFLQIGLEAYEAGGAPEADAAMAAVAWRASAAGGRHDLSLILGDVALFTAFLEAIGVTGAKASRLRAAFPHPARLARELASEDGPVSHSALAGLLVDLDEAQGAAVLEEIWALAGVEPVGERGPADIVRRLAARAGAAPRLEAGERDLVARYLAIGGAPEEAFAQIAELAGGPALDAALGDWRARLAALAEIPAERLLFQTRAARGFGYYDGMFFEVRSAGLGEDQPVAAGGRYDGLPARLGAAVTTGALGCMVRPGRAWREGAA